MDYNIMNYDILVKRIRMYMSKFEGDYSDWYVGIAKDIDEELFKQHKVDEDGIWISFGADTDEIAKEVEKYFLEKNCDGNAVKLDENVRIIYAYKKNSKTVP